MARGELLRKLFASHAHHDDDLFRSVALEIVAEEEQKQNHLLAKDLLRMLEIPQPLKLTNATTVSEQLPKDKERQAFLVDVRQPARSLADIILRKKTREQLVRILDEYRNAEVLRIHGLQPKQRLLHCGPPGCGKSLCAEIIAAELHLPILYTRFDAIISSYLGETSANLRKVFEYARSGTWVVLFDEFDAIGRSRSDPTEHGELKRVVNSYLQLLDSFQGKSLIIAATNYEGALDPALWRRFDDIMLFERPNHAEIRALLAMKLKNFPHRDLDFSKTASRLRGFAHADVEWVCLEAIKTAILQDSDAVTQNVLDAAIARQQARSRIMNSSKERSQGRR